MQAEYFVFSYKYSNLNIQYSDFHTYCCEATRLRSRLIQVAFVSVSVNKVVDIVEEDICFADQSAVVKEFAGGFESYG